MKRFALPRLAALAALGLMLQAETAFAQFVWTDERGVRQYSDRPPPPSVPASRILKQPGGASAARTEVAAAAEKPQVAPQAAPAGESLAEKNAAFRQRRMEQAEKEKKDAEEATRVADNKRNCDRARGYLRALESGQRIATTDNNGERAFMSDEQRNRDLKDARDAVAQCR